MADVAEDARDRRGRRANLPPAEARAKARLLIDDGYKALQANDLETARSYAEQAKALRPDLDWNERNPDRLLADIQRQDRTDVKTAKAPGVRRHADAGRRHAVGRPAGTPADAKDWIKQAKIAMQQDKLDDAEQADRQAADVPGRALGPVRRFARAAALRT